MELGSDDGYRGYGDGGDDEGNDGETQVGERNTPSLNKMFIA